MVDLRGADFSFATLEEVRHKPPHASPPALPPQPSRELHHSGIVRVAAARLMAQASFRGADARGAIFTLARAHACKGQLAVRDAISLRCTLNE